MGCCANCCCQNASPNQISNYLLLIILASFIFSLIVVFIRVGTADKYEDALEILDEKNNNTIYSKFPLSCFRSSSFDEDYYNLDYNHCKFEEKNIRKQDVNISLQTYFKNWKIIELVLNLFRVIFICIYLIYVLVIKLKHLKNIHNSNDAPQAHTNLSDHLIYSTSLSIILIYISGLFLFLRSLVEGIYQEIGLYEEDSNDFKDYMGFNYAVDILDIVFAAISIGFSIRVKQAYNKERRKLQFNPNMQQNQHFPNFNFQNIPIATFKSSGNIITPSQNPNNRMASTNRNYTQSEPPFQNTPNGN